MNKIRDFWERHSTKVYLGMVIIGGVATLIVVRKSILNIRDARKLGKEIVNAFAESNPVLTMNTDEVLKLIDEAAGSGNKYVIFKETLDDVFEVVLL